jgi:hypothetical protein
MDWSPSPVEAGLLQRYPEFVRRPMPGGGVRYVGYIERAFTADDLPSITDAFHLEIKISSRHPKVLPRVYETAGRIPNSYHKLTDDALCLSSPLRLAVALHQTPDLCTFFERFVIPYLYRYAYWEMFRTDPWPELPHGQPGLVQDYIKIFNAASPEQAIEFLKRLGERKRVANKRPCPCGSGSRVGRCHHLRLEKLRGVRPRGWYRAQSRSLRNCQVAGGWAREDSREIFTSAMEAILQPGQSAAGVVLEGGVSGTSSTATGGGPRIGPLDIPVSGTPGRSRRNALLSGSQPSEAGAVSVADVFGRWALVPLVPAE